MKYSEKTLYRKAHAIGYSIHKGKVHYLSGKSYSVYSDEIGYNVVNDSFNLMVWGCYDHVLDHLWDLDDVESFLSSKYNELGLTF